MRMVTTKTLLAAAALALHAAASARAPQPQAGPPACDATSPAARQFKFDGEAPFAGASIRRSMTFDCASILVYRLTPNVPYRDLTKEKRLNPPPDNRPYTGAPVFYARIHAMPVPSD